MEPVSSSVDQREAHCAEPEIGEVLLRNKSTRARVSQTNGTALRSDRTRGRSTRTEATKHTNNMCQRSLCERCMTPSRLWLHHTCRVAKPAGRVDKNACPMAVKSKARNGIRATGKVPPSKRETAFCPSAAISSAPSGTLVSASPDGPKCRSKEGHQACENEPGEGRVCRGGESPPVFLDDGGFSRSPSSLQQRQAPHQTTLQGPPPTTELNGTCDVAPTIVTAKAFAGRRCSARCRRDEVKATPANGDCFSGSDADAECMPAGRRATPLRHSSWTAPKAGRNTSEKPEVADRTCENHLRSGVEQGTPVWNVALKRHNLVRRRTVSYPPTRGTTARDRNCRIFEKATAVAAREAHILMRRQVNWNVWETEPKINVTNKPAGVSPTAREDHGKLTSSKGSLHGTPPLRRDALNEDRQTQCSEESFFSHKYSGGVTASDSDTQEDAPGCVGSSGSGIIHSTTSRKESCRRNTAFSCLGDGVHNVADTDVSDEAEKGHVTASCGEDEAALFENERLGTSLQSVEREHMWGLQKVCGVLFATREKSCHSESAPFLSASELFTNLCSRTKLDRRAEQQEPVRVPPYTDGGSKREHLASCSFEGGRTRLDCICERIEQFLGSVECFLQESDPELRRKELCRIHAACCKR